MNTEKRNDASPGDSLNFIEEIIQDDIKNKKERIHTRFPPEPNGYLHIGHAKAICLNFSLAEKYNGKCNLRFDDTNPATENIEYINSIKEDVRWLGFDWEDREYHASDYFDKLYEYAIYLIKKGLAYVCDMTTDEIGETRGTPTKPGKESPWRNRPVEENLELFNKMKNSEFQDGAKVLRAKINMSSPNMHMRDPVMYRITHTHHHRTKDKWCIYPMYDWAHGQSDYLERITHSLCTLEFEVHRPLYDWFLDALDIKEERPRQIEFARLNLTYTVMSKRKLLELVKDKIVNGWDDPRMPTISGLKRRGYTPDSIRMFSGKVGIAKRENIIDLALLEYCCREHLNRIAARAMVVLNPVKLIIKNFPDDKTEEMSGKINPEDPASKMRTIPFSNTIYIERDDFMEDPPKKFFRLSPGKEVRLKYAYIIKCESVIKNPDSGEITEIHCTYDPSSRSGQDVSGKKVKGTIHWVSAKHTVKAEARLYDRLFTTENPDIAEEGKDFKSNINPDSLKITECFGEQSIKNFQTGDKVQFERIGYFTIDPDSKNDHKIFNRTVTLRDSWSKTKKHEVISHF